MVDKSCNKGTISGLSKPSISIIITVFNAEKTLERCLNSIESQTYSNFEVICVNDGSNDDSLSILNKYASSDSRIRIISQTNQGVAMARQVGMDDAIGDFSIHVDSDDWIEADMLDGMLSAALRNKADMVICDFMKEWTDRKEVICQKPRELDASVVLGQMFNELHGSLCNKLIRNEIIKTNNIRFEEGLNCCEDQLYVMRLLACNIKLSYINHHYYHYVIDPDKKSITQNWFKTPVSQRILFIKKAEILLKTEDQRRCFKEYVARIAYDATYSKKEYCLNFRDYFREYWPLIKSTSIPLYRKVIIWLACLGIHIPR